MDIQLIDVSLGAAQGGNVYHFTIDGKQVDVQPQAGQDATGHDAYRDGVVISLDNEYGHGTDAEVNELIDAFGLALDLTVVRQAEQLAVESAIAELPPRESPEPDDLTRTLARRLWAKYGEERIAGWGDLSPETRESWMRDAKDLLRDWDGDDFVVVRGGIVQNDPRLPVLDMDVLEQDTEASDDVLRLRARALELGAADVAAECAVWLRGHHVRFPDDDV